MALNERVKLKVAAAVVNCLKSEGVQFVFGVPGGQILSILDALYDTPEIRFITAHDERGAACMADGHARISGKIGVCIATAGPGVTNLLTGVGGAMRDSSPVLVLTGNNRSEHMNRDDNQEADHIALLRSLTKWNFLVTRAEQTPWAMHEAFRRALTGCPGPVHLDFCREILEDEYVEYVPLNPANYRIENRVCADTEAIEEIIEPIQKASSPTLWIGRGVCIADASEEVLELADLLQIPIITTYNGIGSVPTCHPLVFGSKFRHCSRLTSKILKETDLLILVGNSMNAATTSRWKEQLPDKIVQIDIDPNIIGRHYPIRVGINGDAKSVLTQLLNTLKSNPLSKELIENRHRRIVSLMQWKDDWKKEVFPVEHGNATPIKPQFLMKTLREVLPADAIFVAGAGNPGIWSNLLDIYEVGTYMKPVGFGNMGFALPAAIATKLVHPERPVVCIIGDGSLGMCISEIETAVRENAPVVIVVMNNLSYGNIKQEQLVHYGPRYIGVDFTDSKYSMIARGFGAEGSRINHPSNLAAELRTALASEKTFLLDVLIDPDENVWLDPL
jgi:acetolactate synthase-1/2/3 large subunit